MLAETTSMVRARSAVGLNSTTSGVEKEFGGVPGAGNVGLAATDDILRTVLRSGTSSGPLRTTPTCMH